jgi:ribonuclease HII
VVFPANTIRRGSLKAIDDSKRLTAGQREVAEMTIRKTAACWGIGTVDAETIDEIGISRSNRLAMELAVNALQVEIDFALLDALTCELTAPQLGLIDGDALSLSIAAASILAKTERDRTMRHLHESHRQYGFDRHVGYGTSVHLRALRMFGPCAIHRRTFRGVLPELPA